MAKSVEQINRDLAGLESQSQSLSQELRSLYDNYLDELGKAAYQRLISVCYQLCTQAFPEAFLKLSMSDRDRLQRSIKEESQSLQGQLALDPLLQMKDESSRLEAALLEEVQKISQQQSSESDSSEVENLAKELSALNLTEPDFLENSLSEIDDSSPGLPEIVPSSDVSPRSNEPNSNPEFVQDTNSAPSGAESVSSELVPPHSSSDFSTTSLGEEQSPDSQAPDSQTPDSQTPDSQTPESNISDDQRQENELQANPSEEPNTMEASRNPERMLPVTLIHAGEGPLSPGMLASAIAAEADNDSDSPRPMQLAQPQPEDDPQKPGELRAWQERLERRISQKLRRSSQAITRLLEKSNVLNNQLPEGLFAPAPEEPMGESERKPPKDRRDLSRREFSARDTYSGRETVDLRSPASPHILNLTLESADGSKKKKRDARLQIVAIYLRLAELEFEAPLLMGWRNKIRTTLKTLQGLERQYEQKLRERSVAEAEAAWRSTWSNN